MEEIRKKEDEKKGDVMCGLQVNKIIACRNSLILWRKMLLSRIAKE
jgi:hypothetical protein